SGTSHALPGLDRVEESVACPDEVPDSLLLGYYRPFTKPAVLPTEERELPTQFLVGGGSLVAKSRDTPVPPEPNAVPFGQQRIFGGPPHAKAVCVTDCAHTYSICCDVGYVHDLPRFWIRHPRARRVPLPLPRRLVYQVPAQATRQGHRRPFASDRLPGRRRPGFRYRRDGDHGRPRSPSLGRAPEDRCREGGTHAQGSIIADSPRGVPDVALACSYPVDSLVLLHNRRR